jgi:carboxymethylenebutenolidase
LDFFGRGRLTAIIVGHRIVARRQKKKNSRPRGAAIDFKEERIMALAGQVTNPERVEERDVSFQSDGTAINAYLARPREPGSYPGIIVIHEAWGVNDHIRDVTRRFANLGYVALAPDLYTRVGAPKAADSMDVVISRMLSLSDRQLVRDLDKAADLLASQPGMNGKIGCVGFCMGGRTTLLYACSSNRLSAAIDCWGGAVTADAAPVTPQRPVPIADLVPQLSCPLYLVGGEEDANPSPAQLEALSQRLRQAGKTFTVDIFKNAGHAFLADYRPSYREKAAFELWPKIASFFETHLNGKK